MRDTKFRTRLFLCFLAVIVMTLVLPGLYVRIRNLHRWRIFV